MNDKKIVGYLVLQTKSSSVEQHYRHRKLYFLETNGRHADTLTNLRQAWTKNKSLPQDTSCGISLDLSLHQ